MYSVCISELHATVNSITILHKNAFMVNFHWWTTAAVQWSMFLFHDTIAEQYTAKNYHWRRNGVTSTWSEMQTAKHSMKNTCISKMQKELMWHHKC